MKTKFFVKTRIIKYIKENYGLKISKRYLSELEEYLKNKIERTISLSVANCKQEKRKTLLKRDLIEAKEQRTLLE